MEGIHPTALFPAPLQTERDAVALLVVCHTQIIGVFADQKDLWRQWHQDRHGVVQLCYEVEHIERVCHKAIRSRLPKILLIVRALEIGVPQQKSRSWLCRLRTCDRVETGSEEASIDTIIAVQGDGHGP